MIALLILAIIAACVLPALCVVFAISRPSTDQDGPIMVLGLLILAVVITAAASLYQHRFEPLVNMSIEAAK